jgi:hypothetical protein
MFINDPSVSVIGDGAWMGKSLLEFKHFEYQIHQILFFVASDIFPYSRTGRARSTPSKHFPSK